MLAPGGTSKGLEDVETLPGTLTYCLYVRREGVVRVEGNPQDGGGPTQCEVGPLIGDMWVCSGLVGVGGKESAVGFGD